MPTDFSTIDEALADIRAGRFVIVTDDEDRENEGDLVMAAEKVTPEAIGFLRKHTTGIVTVPMTGEQLAKLNLPPLSPVNNDPHRTAFHMTVDYRHGTTTGVSDYDRAETIRALISAHSAPDDFTRPGHVQPLRAREGGVLVRTGHTEASVDLARLAGLLPAGIICEIVNDDGTMARLPQLVEFAQMHCLKIITIAQLIAYRRRNEKLVRRVESTGFPTALGNFTLHAYESVVDGTAYLALTMGTLAPETPTLVRVHSGCLTGDALFSLRCECGDQLRVALQRIANEGHGVLLYIPHHEGRGIGLINKIRAHALQEQGHDTVTANEALGFKPDPREYGLGAQVLCDLGVSKMRLMTNNPSKRVGLKEHGLEEVERVPLEVEVHEHNREYLKTKKEKMGHLLGV